MTGSCNVMIFTISFDSNCPILRKSMTHFMIQCLYMCIVATVISINKNCKMPYMSLNKVM